MSERQEKKRRFNQKMEYVAQFNAWLMKEPPMWKLRAWLHWKKTRPVMEDLARYLEGKR